MAFSRTRRIRFSDCDPAGIVFYPQYFVLFNDLLDEWIDSTWDGGFADFIVHRRLGLPTVQLNAEFKAISRMGDDVVLTLDVTRIGQRSFDLALGCTGAVDRGLRMSARQTLVTTSLETHRSMQIPPQLRQALVQLAPAATAGADAAAR
jgi:4-hydroxybenzoyl-CoA thioesterase